jgi:hypothetical protein
LTMAAARIDRAAVWPSRDWKDTSVLSRVLL